MKTSALDYVNREHECEHIFNQQDNLWHLCTPGKDQEMIFKNEDDYKFGITSSAMSLYDINNSGKKLKLYAFALMSNHIHNLLSGSREDCLEYFSLWRRRLKKYFSGKVDLSCFKANLVHVDNLKSLRYEIAYINRNGFVHNQKEIPFSYEWSSGRYYFNPATREIPSTSINKLNCREKKALFRSRLTDSYDSLMTFKSYISPLCFCEIAKGESFYNTPHQYFNHLYKNVEEYSEISKVLGESIFLNDDEMYSATIKSAKDKYNVDELKQLGSEERIEIARFIHWKYNASNSQIQRMLKLDRYIVESLFPKPQ